MCNSPEIIVSLDVVTPPPPEIPWLIIGVAGLGIVGAVAVTKFRRR